MLRVIFVGIHHKPGKKPLDSSTKTGKVIDKVIVDLNKRAVTCFKTNLYDTNKMPHEEQKRNLSLQWHESARLKETDIIILLGTEVIDNFYTPNEIRGTCLHFPHPSYKLRQGANALNKYTDEMTQIINLTI